MIEALTSFLPPLLADHAVVLAVVIPLALRDHACQSRSRFLDHHAARLYDLVTGARTRLMRIEALLAEAGAHVPGLVPSDDDFAFEAGRRQGEVPERADRGERS